MSYKDTRGLHKEFSDGGRKVRAQIRQIEERKSNKYSHKTQDIVSSADTIPQWECKGCGYIGDELNDFAVTDDEGDISDYRCPSCGSYSCGETEENILDF